MYHGGIPHGVGGFACEYRRSAYSSIHLPAERCKRRPKVVQSLHTYPVHATEYKPSAMSSRARSQRNGQTSGTASRETILLSPNTTRCTCHRLLPTNQKL